MNTTADVVSKPDSSEDETSAMTEELQQEEELVVDLEAGRRNSNGKLRLTCPLTKEPFRDPVVHPSGVTYEREALEEMFVGISCYPNRAIQKYLDPSTDVQSSDFMVEELEAMLTVAPTTASSSSICLPTSRINCEQGSSCPTGEPATTIERTSRASIPSTAPASPEKRLSSIGRSNIASD